MKSENKIIELLLGTSRLDIRMLNDYEKDDYTRFYRCDVSIAANILKNHNISLKSIARAKLQSSQSIIYDTKYNSKLQCEVLDISDSDTGELLYLYDPKGYHKEMFDSDTIYTINQFCALLNDVNSNIWHTYKIPENSVPIARIILNVSQKLKLEQWLELYNGGYLDGIIALTFHTTTVINPKLTGKPLKGMCK